MTKFEQAQIERAKPHGRSALLRTVALELLAVDLGLLRGGGKREGEGDIFARANKQG